LRRAYSRRRSSTGRRRCRIDLPFVFSTSLFTVRSPSFIGKTTSHTQFFSFLASAEILLLADLRVALLISTAIAKVQDI